MSVVRKISKGKTCTQKDNVLYFQKKKYNSQENVLKKEFYFINLSHGYGVFIHFAPESV